MCGRQQSVGACRAKVSLIASCMSNSGSYGCGYLLSTDRLPAFYRIPGRVAGNKVVCLISLRNEISDLSKCSESFFAKNICISLDTTLVLSSSSVFVIRLEGLQM